MNIREPRDFEGVRSQRRAKHTVRRAKNIVLGIFLAFFIVVLLGFGSYARALPLITIQPTLPAITTDGIALAWPATGQAAIGAQGQGVMAATNHQTPVPTASTTKLMVAWMTLKKYPLELGQTGPVLTVTPGNVQEYNDYIAQGGSAVRVEAGTQYNQYQALQALLLPSANNIADLLAVWGYGSLPAYFEAANAEARVLGMNQTTFAGDASGLSPRTTSTAHDMTLLGQAVMSHPVIADIVKQKSATLPLVGTVYNTNLLLGRDGIIGVKTGNTDEAGGAYVFATNYTLPNGKPITVIGAIMAAPNLPAAMAYSLPLLNSFYQGFTQIPIVQAGQEVGSFTIPWDGSGRVQAQAPLSVLGWRTSKPTVTAIYEPVTVGMAAGALVGHVSARTPFDEARVPVVLAQAIADPTWSWRVVRRSF